MKKFSHLKHTFLLLLLLVITLIVSLKANYFAADNKTAIKIVPSKEAKPANDDEKYEATGPAVESKLNARTINFNKTEEKTMRFNSFQTTWIYDSTAKLYKLAYLDPFCKDTFVVNSFVVLDNTKTYLFDENGHRVTGWVVTPDGNFYFFNNESGVNEAVMCTGWKEISHLWYYFDNDGKMLYNTETPDGYRVEYEGNWDGKAAKPKTNNHKENVDPNKVVIYAA